MKPEHFIYKSDGLYYIPNMPEKRLIGGSTYDSIADASTYNALKWEYEQALERAKSEAIPFNDYFIGLRRILHSMNISCGEGNEDLVRVAKSHLKEGEIYTINMEEKIEVYDMELTSCEHCISCQLIPNCTTLAARIAAPKNESDHECTMDLMTDVCVYSCECGKIEVASNLSYHDKPKRYIPESSPKKEEESEDGISLIAKERTEQLTKHGRSVYLDFLQNSDGQLSDAASKLCVDDKGGYWSTELLPTGWDQVIWDKMTNKSYKERIIIAGALIAAEIDRIIFIEKDDKIKRKPL